MALGQITRETRELSDACRMIPPPAGYKSYADREVEPFDTVLSLRERLERHRPISDDLVNDITVWEFSDGSTIRIERKEITTGAATHRGIRIYG